MIPAYLFIFPAPRTTDPQFFLWVWLIELVLLVLFCVAGIAYCLRKCRVDPARNFLVDFSCLNAPVSLTTLAIVWAGFYLLAEAVLPLLGETSSRVYDVLRMLASAGAALIVFVRIGRHMDRVSSLRAR
jgi:hypothetical protein